MQQATRAHRLTLNGMWCGAGTRRTPPYAGILVASGKVAVLASASSSLVLATRFNNGRVVITYTEMVQSHALRTASHTLSLPGKRVCGEKCNISTTLTNHVLACSMSCQRGQGNPHRVSSLSPNWNAKRRNSLRRSFHPPPKRINYRIQYQTQPWGS